MTARTSFHWRRLLPLLLACIAGSTLAQAAPTLGNGIAVPPGLALKLPSPAEAALSLPAPDRAKLAREDATTVEGRYRYAVPMPVKSAATQAKSARWETLPDGRRRWAFLIEGDGAKTLDLIFSRYWLPNGAELWVRSPDHNNLVHGPYTDAHNSLQGVLATPVTQGGKTLVEVVVPAGLEHYVELELGTVHYGYRGFSFEGGVPVPKAGSCNVDTICPQGDAWRDQIRGVGRYTVGGGLCTGTLVNNSAGDRRPLFLTARHCFSSQADANTVVVFWRYESPTCRTVNSAANGQVIPLNHTATNSGSQLLMSFGNADMTLVALNQPVPAAAQPYFVGWDRRDVVPNSAVAIHHPAGDEKRISFENNPLALGSFATGSINLAQGAALRVNDWDLGTTEQGSSGSALFNPEKRLVGTLAGGSAQCGNDLDDNYGRVFIGWTGGGAASSRLSDHLAPGGVAPQTVDGLDGVAGSGPGVTVTVRPGATVQAGTDAFVDITVNGTGAPFTVAVDLEGDGITDRTLTGVAAGQVQSLPVRFPRQANYTVRATATGSGGTASGQFGVAVTAHDVRATFGSTAQQLCGDGDGLVEPGEQWRLPVSLFNAGANPTTTQNSWSIFGKALSGPAGAGAPLATDAFGYTVRDTANGSCGYQFIDLTQIPEATPLTLTAASPNFPATDDGATNTLNLGATYSFELYGQTVSTIKIGTNGYISTNSGIIGGDFTPNCNASPVSDGGGLRLNALHADLVINDIRALGYTNCPRPSNVGAANQPCLIVQWSGARQFVSNGSPSGNFDLQAIIYPQSRAIIYQTRGTLPTTTEFPASTIGLQRVPTSALNYTCTAARRPIQTSNAVCYYHPAAQPTGGSGATVNPTQLRLLTPAVGLNGAVSGSTTQRNVDVHLARDLACGSTARIRYLGTVDERAYSGVITESTLNVGGAGCAPVTTCPEPANTVSLKSGAHFNPARAGNGLLPYPAGQVGGLPQFFVPWFTAEANRNPTWYALQSTVEQNQITSPILRFARNGNPPTWVAPTSAVVGQAQVTLVETGQLVLTHQFTGQNAGGERMIALLPAQAPSPNRTGAWYNPAESGWGITFDTFSGGGVPNDFIATFFYDTAGAPRWATAQGPAGQLTAQVLTPHCPNCIWTDADPTRRNIGTLNRNFSGPRNGTFTINVDTGAPQQVLWQRNAMPFELLTDLIP